jgi:hypothetical protein
MLRQQEPYLGYSARRRSYRHRKREGIHLYELAFSRCSKP